MCNQNHGFSTAKTALVMRFSLLDGGDQCFHFLHRDAGRGDGIGIFVIRPDEPLNIGPIERNPDELQRVYELGRAAATRNLDALKAYFEV